MLGKPNQYNVRMFGVSTVWRYCEEADADTKNAAMDTRRIIRIGCEALNDNAYIFKHALVFLIVLFLAWTVLSLILGEILIAVACLISLNMYFATLGIMIGLERDDE